MAYSHVSGARRLVPGTGSVNGNEQATRDLPYEDRRIGVAGTTLAPTRMLGRGYLPNIRKLNKPPARPPTASRVRSIMVSFLPRMALTPTSWS